MAAHTRSLYVRDAGWPRRGVRMARDHVLLARGHRSHLIRAGHCARIDRIPADAGLPIEHVEYLRRPDPDAAGPTPGESRAGRRSVRRGGGRRTLGSRRAHSRPRWQGADHKRHGERRKTDSHAAWIRQAVGVPVGCEMEPSHQVG